MTVAPSMDAATRTESVPWKRGRSPPSMPEGLGGATNRPARNPSVMTISRPTMIVSNWRCLPSPWTTRSAMDTAPMMTPPHSSEIPKRRWRASAPPMTSARSVAAATISAWIQKAMRPGLDMRSPRRAGRDRPVTRPSLADRYWTTIAKMLEARRTHTSR